MKPIIVLIALLFSSLSWGESVQFELPGIDGTKKYRLADYKGKWVVINYWATWCPPCLDEIPELVDFHEAHAKKDAVVLGVNYEQVDRTYLKTFVDEYFISYPVLVTNPKHVPPFGRIYGLPTTYIVSPAGKLVESKIGGITRAKLEAIIKQHQDKVGKQK